MGARKLSEIGRLDEWVPIRSHGDSLLRHAEYEKLVGHTHHATVWRMVDTWAFAARFSKFFLRIGLGEDKHHILRKRPWGGKVRVS